MSRPAVTLAGDDLDGARPDGVGAGSPATGGAPSGNSASAPFLESDRDKEMLDPRVMVDMHKERIAPKKALEERFNEAERRRQGGGAR